MDVTYDESLAGNTVFRIDADECALAPISALPTRIARTSRADTSARASLATRGRRSCMCPMARAWSKRRLRTDLTEVAGNAVWAAIGLQRRRGTRRPATPRAPGAHNVGRQELESRDDRDAPLQLRVHPIGRGISDGAGD